MRVGSTSRPTLTVPRSAGRRHGWRPPYALPNAGEVVSISTNFASDVKPTAHSVSEYNRALFGYYGGGAFVEEYSVGGAFVVAGSGGHGVPPNVGAAIFDFADATWKRLDNANGVAWQAGDYTAAQIDSTYGEITAATTSGIPAPAHLYSMLGQRKSSGGGGPNGSFLRLQGRSAGTNADRGSNHAHAMNLSTGLWTRLSTNAVVNTHLMRTSAYDPANNRWYLPQELMFNGESLNYLDGNDWTFKTQGFPNPGTQGNTHNCFVDLKRRMLLIHNDDAELFAMDLDNVGDGLTQLTLSGSLPANEFQYPWQYYPADDCFYMFAGLTTTATIRKLKPPASTPFSSAWTVSNATLSSTLTQQPQTYIDDGAVHNTRFFFQPRLGCFAWIPGNDTAVVLLKPPA